MLDVACKNDKVWGEEGDKRLTNRIVSYVASRHDEVREKEASKGKESPFYVSNVMGKEEEQVKDHLVIEGDRNPSKLLQGHMEAVKYNIEAD